MSAVGQVTRPLQNIVIPEQSQIDHVVEAVKTIFRQIVDFVIHAWNVTLAGIQNGFHTVSFVLFRAFEWIHPTLGPRLEVVFLRVSHIWESVKGAWKEEAAQREMDRLRTQNQELQTQLQQLAQANNENTKLRNTLARLTPLEELTTTYQQQTQSLLKQQENIADQEKVVVQQRDLLRTQNSKLAQANAQLLNERKLALAACILYTVQNKELQQQVQDLTTQMENRGAYKESLAKTAQVCAQLPEGQREVVSLLLHQLSEARANLRDAKQKLPPRTSAEIVLGNLDRVLEDLAGCFPAPQTQSLSQQKEFIYSNPLAKV